MAENEETTSKDDENKELYKGTVKVCSRRTHTKPQIYEMIDQDPAMTTAVLGIVPTSTVRPIR